MAWFGMSSRFGHALRALQAQLAHPPTRQITVTLTSKASPVTLIRNLQELQRIIVPQYKSLQAITMTVRWGSNRLGSMSSSSRNKYKNKDILLPVPNLLSMITSLR